MARSNINGDGVFWTEPYADDVTGEQLTTAAKVVYESQGGKHMMGVAGVDVPLKALGASSNFMSMLSTLQMRSKACYWSKPDECEMHGFGNGAVDPSLLETLPL